VPDETAGLEIKAHPHMLRHACGFKLANDGVDTRALQAYLGHKSIQHTVRYTELAPSDLIVAKRNRYICKLVRRWRSFSDGFRICFIG
jgi:site-specific recombinase XerD